MSKSRTKKYFVDDDADQNDRNLKKKRFEDRRAHKKEKAALKTQNLDYFEERDDA